MFKFYRIPSQPRSEITTSKSFNSNGGEGEQFLDKLVRLVPSEASTLYIYGQGILDKSDDISLIIWSLFCLLIAGLVRYIGTKDPESNSRQWGAIIIACVSFIIFVYYTGGPFLLIPEFHNAKYALLIVAAWTTTTTLFYNPKNA